MKPLDGRQDYREVEEKMMGTATTRRSGLDITCGDITIALDIMREAASWLIDLGQPLWLLDDLTEGHILADITQDDVYVGWTGGKSAAAMILQWQDPVFWPDAQDDSAFIHKLSVRRRFAGTGSACKMVGWAAEEARRRGKQFLRLDCAGDRPKLCAFYCGLGFRQTTRRMMGKFDVAFYELCL